MGVIEELSSARGERGDAADIALAVRIAETGDAAAVRELVEHLDDPDQAVRSDCVKALYETGYRNPALLVPYAERFLKLLTERNNRLVWGGMIALSTIAQPAAAVIHGELPLILKTMAEGSVITVDAGIRVLTGVATAGEASGKTTGAAVSGMALLKGGGGVPGDEFGAEIRPILLEHFRTYPVKYLPNHAEMAERCFTGVCRVTGTDTPAGESVSGTPAAEFAAVLRTRSAALAGNALKRMERIVRRLEKRNDT